MPNALPVPIILSLIPLREFHLEHGQGRTVAVLFGMAVDHIDQMQHGRDQDDADQQALGAIGEGQ